MTQKNSFFYNIFDIVLNIIIIIAVVSVIRTFLVSPFQVEGRSMVSTLHDNEYIIINKLVYFLQDPEPGEIVVFKPPVDESKYYVKRVIGSPGDTITIREGKVFRTPAGSTTEVELSEWYLDEDNAGQTYAYPSIQTGQDSPAEITYTVPDGMYFLMGDNRRGSSDSRSFRTADGTEIPFVPKDNIKGRVWFVALPLKNIHALVQADYSM
jgi:signal peptidase I